MHLVTYTDLFRELARTHLAILATPENGRFLRILISADPIQKQLDTSEFYSALRTRLKAPAGQAFLVLENYQTDYDDNQGDYLSRKLAGAFFVLQKVKLDDYDARDKAIAACEQVAEQVLAAAVERLRALPNTFVTVGECFAEHIGPIGDGHYGVRTNFSWAEGATPELTYDPANFLSS